MIQPMILAALTINVLNSEVKSGLLSDEIDKVYYFQQD